MRRFESGGPGRPLLVERLMKGRESSGLSAFALRSGIVTFLVAEVEGSVAPPRAEPDATRRVVGRFDEVLGTAVKRNGGMLAEGGARRAVAAFPTAPDALAAAVEAQRALLAGDWPGGAAPSVRIAVHTGAGRLRHEGERSGATVARCGCLAAIANEGQVLLSRATRDLAAASVPDGVDLVDLGVHRLRDLGRPEHVFAVVDPDRPATASPPSSLDAYPNNLPGQLSSFVGRRVELGELDRRLADLRLLTLTGAGGCGKTRLALQLVAGAISRYPDGAWWVELGSLADPDRVDDALANAIGVRPLPGVGAAEAAAARLSTKRAVILLDDCEHLLGPCGALAEQLLHACPEVTVLATSREPLGLPGETSWRVPSLSLPPEPEAEPVESLIRADAVRLFAERALQVRPNFAITDENAPAVARICAELDGIPLAIELAAARVRMLSPEQIAAGLADRFRLLTGGARTALARQQTLHASVDWSHELLDEPERALLRRLGAFVGGFTLDLCEEVCGDAALDRYAILGLLGSLVDKSLVVAEEHNGAARYRLLETIRHFALDRLAEAGEGKRLRGRHRDAFVRFAEAAEPGLLSERQPDALELLDAEAANLHAAIEWAAETAPELALRLCTALTFWWRLRGSHGEGQAAFRRALDAAPAESMALVARALWGQAYLATLAGESELGERSARESLAIGEELEDEWIQGRALHVVATFQLFSDPRAAVETAKRSRELARSAGDDFAFADATQILGGALWSQDDYEAARAELDRSFEVAERIGNRELMAWHWLLRGMIPFGSADLDRRREELKRGLASAAEIGELGSAGFGTAWLGLLDVWTGAPATALASLERCLEQLVVAGVGPPITSVQGTLGLAQAALGLADEARATLAGVVEREADGVRFRLSESLTALAALERQAGEASDARAHAAQALEVADHVGSAVLAALARHELARQEAAGGNCTAAERLLHDSLGALIAGEHHVFVPDSLEALAEVAAGLDSHLEAVRLLATAGRARERLGLVRWTGEHERWRALERELRGALGSEDHSTATAEGRKLTLGEAVSYVRRMRGERKRPAGGWESLTPTELEVVRHAAAGLTNPEIGERMFIARSTVKTHLVHIYAKLGVRNRAELAAAEAARRAGEGGN